MIGLIYWLWSKVIDKLTKRHLFIRVRYAATKIWSTIGTLTTVVSPGLKTQLFIGGYGLILINMKRVEASASENKCKYKHPELGWS